MADKKTGDPKDEEQLVGGARFVPVTGTYGTEVVVPGSLTAGRPKPEPEERWTLAPGHRTEPPAGADDEPVPGGAPVEPVHARVTRPATGGSEPDRS